MISEEERRELYRKSFKLSDVEIRDTVKDILRLTQEELDKPDPDFERVHKLQSHYALLEFVLDVRKNNPDLRVVEQRP